MFNVNSIAEIVTQIIKRELIIIKRRRELTEEIEDVVAVWHKEFSWFRQVDIGVKFLVRYVACSCEIRFEHTVACSG